jgi:predicted hydrolase (HD superfamily)
MLAVEAAVVAYAERDGADVELWAATALLHDFDYERHPDLGPDGPPLRRRGPPALARARPRPCCEAILGHADHTGVPRETRLAKVLYACDEITGLVTAAVLVRPDKDIAGGRGEEPEEEVQGQGVRAWRVRDDVRRGAEELGVDLWDHVAFVLAAMQGRAATLGLDGSASAGADGPRRRPRAWARDRRRGGTRTFQAQPPPGVERSGGQITHAARPATSAVGTAPNARESREASGVRLSPSTNT